MTLAARQLNQEPCLLVAGSEAGEVAARGGTLLHDGDVSSHCVRFRVPGDLALADAREARPPLAPRPCLSNITRECPPSLLMLQGNTLLPF